MPMPILHLGKRPRVFPSLRDRVYLSISSEGYGHSSRALAIANQFDKEDVLIGTYGYALDRVKRFGYQCVSVPQEVKFVGSEGSFDVGKTILQNPARVLGFNQIVQDEIEILKKFGISLVVADGRMAPVLAAARLNIPCVVVTNQSAFYPFFARDSALVKLFGRSFEWVMKFWLSSAEEILIPDFPPPDTVCLPNLSDNYQVKKRTRFVGPLVAWDPEQIVPLPRETDRPLVVVSLGGHAYRRPLFDAVLAMAAQDPHRDFLLLTPFTAPQLPSNVSLCSGVKECAAHFKAADVVITQAGHSTAMELLTLGKPSIVVPDTRQIEQENNAKRMVELGVSLKVEYHQLEHGLLSDALEAVFCEPSFRIRAEAMATKAHAIRGAATAANVLRDYAHRLLAY